MYEENFEAYGARKVWRQLGREGLAVARCTIERLMRVLGCKGGMRAQVPNDDCRRCGGTAAPSGGRASTCAASFPMATAAASICRLATASAWPKPASNPRWAASATPTTTRWRNPSRLVR